ncbi:BCCT family transporter [Petroclostridium sp. X23]|uniref:BCCT family transporter n=1 Tax=Petroclostridium sp. X23 TaxID=3045146 RepID=UPI0024ACFFE4|nr:BCCT family transporter [Petroclostridium sp. X23]WHH57961.1 BCCT family transporter [Petroclostridium sp. X23]
MFYLAWWISWSPFVGMFIARISKGRSIREFVLAVLIIPSLLSFIWLSVFGGTAIYLNSTLNGSLFATVQDKLPIALFEMISYLNLPIFSGLLKILLSAIATILVISFFVTSSDSGSLVVDNITSGGKLDSPVPQRVFWSFMEGFAAAILLLKSKNIQTSFILIIIIVSIPAGFFPPSL